MVGIVEFSPADQIVIVRPGTPIKMLQEEVGKRGYCLPLPSSPYWHKFCGMDEASVGGMISSNFPHPNESLAGNWRDWVLAIRTVRGNGERVRVGANVVKNVAGFDLHKMFIGAWGGIGLITEVTLKLFPKRALPKDLGIIKNQDIVCNWIQRVAPTHLEKAILGMGQRVLAFDPEMGTIWANVGPKDQIQRFEHDWVMTNITEHAQENLRHFSDAERMLLPRYRETLGENGRWVQGGPWTIR